MRVIVDHRDARRGREHLEPPLHTPELLHPPPDILEGRPGVRLAGRVDHDEVPAWIAACDVLCLPSLTEPFGMVLLEAMAMERSVVATRVGGPPEFVAPEAGVLVDPHDVADIARGLREAVALPSPNPAARRAAAGHDLRRQVAKRQRQARQEGPLDGTLQEVRELLDTALEAERRELFPDPSDAARMREMELDTLPNDTARAVQALKPYDWRSDEARQAYEQIDDLRGRRCARWRPAPAARPRPPPRSSTCGCPSPTGASWSRAATRRASPPTAHRCCRASYRRWLPARRWRSPSS
ncbi:MAG: glycosyltransferase [Actinobacteria bacterium]|nr:glycosyltransferase [Actinomycetota bacterium]